MVLNNGIFHVTMPDGSKFLGEFKNDIENGNGQWNYTDGKIFSGIYKEGKMNGHGIK